MSSLYRISSIAILQAEEKGETGFQRYQRPPGQKKKKTDTEKELEKQRQEQERENKKQAKALRRRLGGGNTKIALVPWMHLIIPPIEEIRQWRNMLQTQLRAFYPTQVCALSSIEHIYDVLIDMYQLYHGGPARKCHHLYCQHYYSIHFYAQHTACRASAALSS
jgi:hypothetical protein